MMEIPVAKQMYCRIPLTIFKNTFNPKNVVRTESKKLTTAKDTGISYYRSTTQVRVAGPRKRFVKRLYSSLPEQLMEIQSNLYCSNSTIFAFSLVFMNILPTIEVNPVQMHLQ